MVSWKRWPSWVTTPTVCRTTANGQVPDVDAAEAHRARRRRRRGGAPARPGSTCRRPTSRPAPPSARARPGATRRGARPRHRGRRGRRPPRGRPARPRRPTGSGSARRRARPATGPVGHGRGVGRLGDQRLDVEDLEDPLEADQGGDHVEAGGGQRGERRVEPGQQQGHGDDGAGVEVALQGQVAAEAVDERLGQARHQGQGPQEHLGGHGRAHADVAAPAAARRPNSSASSAGPAEQLDQRGARGGEALGHLRGHGRVVGRGLPLEVADPGARPGGRGSRTRAAAPWPAA